MVDAMFVVVVVLAVAVVQKQMGFANTIKKNTLVTISFVLNIKTFKTKCGCFENNKKHLNHNVYRLPVNRSPEVFAQAKMETSFRLAGAISTIMK